MDDMEHMSNTAFVIGCAVLWTLAFVLYRIDKKRKR